MAQSTQNVKTRAEKPSPQKTNLPSIETSQNATQAALPAGPAAALNGESLDAQTALLQRMAGAQQQAAFRNMGNILGNRQMQNVAQQTRSSPPQTQVAPNAASPEPEMQTEVMAALENMLANSFIYAEDIVDAAIIKTYPNGVLMNYKGDLGTSDLVNEEEKALTTELNGIAKAASIAQEKAKSKQQSNANANIQNEQNQSYDALTSDFEMLKQYHDVRASGNQELIADFTQNLTPEQQTMAIKYLQNGENAILGVATGVIERMKPAREKALTGELKKRTLDKVNWNPGLDDIGRAQDSSFAALELAWKIRKAVKGWGTDEKAIFSALQNRTPEQIKAIRDAYASDAIGRNLDKDLRGDLNDEEYERAQAALSGDTSMQDAMALDDAMHGSLFGWGTDEDAIMSTLRNKTPEEIEKIKEAYKKKYGHDLISELEDDMGGHDIDQAKALLEGDVAKADAIALDQDMHGGFFGWGTDEKGIEETYTKIEDEVKKEAAKQGMTTEEMEAEILRRKQLVEQAYDKEYANNKDGETLREAFKSEMSGAELDLANALADNDHAAADAAKLKHATRYQGAAPVLAGLLFGSATPESTAITQDMLVDDDAVENMLRGQGTRAEEDLKRDSAAFQKRQADLQKRKLLEGWTEEEYNLKMYELETAVGVDEELATIENKKTALRDEAVRDKWETGKLDAELQKLDETLDKAIEERAKENMADLDKTYSDQYGNQSGPTSIQEIINTGTSGLSQEKNQLLFDQGGRLNKGQEVYYAIKGAGTDEENLNKVMLGVDSPEEMERIKKEYAEAKYGAGVDIPLDEFKSDVLGDVSGRDDADIRDMFDIYGSDIKATNELERQKELADRKVQVLQTRRDREFSWGGSGLGSLFAGEEHKLLDYSVAQAEKEGAEYKEALDDYAENPNKNTLSQLHRQEGYLDRWAKYSEFGLKEHREAVDKAADVASQVASVVVAVAATVAAIVTAGALSPLAAAAIAAAAGATGIGVKAAMRGGSYGYEEFGTDAALLVVDVAASYATAGMGASKFLKAGFMKELIKSGVGDLAPALAGLLANEKIWESENTLELLLGGMAKEMAMLPVKAGASVAFDNLKLDKKLLNGPFKDMYTGSPTSRIIAHGLASGSNDLISGMPVELVSLLTNPDTWASGDPTATILSKLGTSGLKSFTTGTIKGMGSGVYEKNNKAWDNPRLTEEEFMESYKKQNPDTPLSDLELKNRYKQGLRLDPETGEWNQLYENKVKAWDDPSMSQQEFIDSYRLRYPKTSLSDDELKAYYDGGSRLNPATGRLKKIENTPVKSNKTDKQQKGIFGEYATRQLYNEQGYTYIDTNKDKSNFAGIDGVAYKEGEILFVQSKAHSSVSAIKGYIKNRQTDIDKAVNELMKSSAGQEILWELKNKNLIAHNITETQLKQFIAGRMIYTVPQDVYEQLSDEEKRYAQSTGVNSDEHEWFKEE